MAQNKQKKSESNGKITGKNPVNGQFLPGNKLGGRTAGAVDFKTKFYLMLDKIAKNNNMTPDEVEEQLLMVGYKKAKEGDYSFYRDVMDRVHGRPIQKNELTGADGKDLPIPILGTYVPTNNITEQGSVSNEKD